MNPGLFTLPRSSGVYTRLPFDDIEEAELRTEGVTVARAVEWEDEHGSVSLSANGWEHVGMVMITMFIRPS